MTSVFGNFVPPPMVEDATQRTLERWFPTYLREMERQTGHEEGAFPDIASWRAADTIEDRLPEEMIPSVEIEFTSDVEMYSEAETSSALFNGTIDVLVASIAPEDARRLASWYAFTIGAILEQKSGLDGSLKVAGLQWEKLKVPAVSNPEGRWLGLGTVELTMLVNGVFDNTKGPVLPREEEDPNQGKDGHGEPPVYPRVATHKLIEKEL